MRSCGCLFVEEMTIEAEEEVEMEMYAAASFWPHCLRTGRHLLGQSLQLAAAVLRQFNSITIVN